MRGVGARPGAAAVALLALALAVAGPAFGLPDEVPPLVSATEVVSSHPLPEALVRASVDPLVGRPRRRGAVRESVEQLWALGLFSQVTVEEVEAIFVALGARSYAEDVAFIESEMVAAARWSADHLPADALVAAHDIGALGYFDGHALIDLAGLITPDVVPFIRDESQIVHYLDLADAKYLVTFQDWYPQLVAGRDPIFVAGSESFSFEDNMSVYQWK